MFGPTARSRHHSAEYRPSGRARLAPLAGLLIVPLVAAGLVAADTGSARPAGLVTESAGCSCPEVLFKDYFNTSRPDWEFINREGSIKRGRLVINGDYVPDSFGRDGWAMTHVGDRTWRAYSFSASFDTKNAGGSPSEVHQAEFFFRVIKNGKRGRGTYYRLSVWDPGVPDPTGNDRDMSKGLVQLQRYKKGEATTLRQRYYSNTVTGFNQMRVKVQGERIVVWLNGKRVMRVTDPTPLKYGGVGVGRIWETKGGFDNVRVWR